MHSEVWREKHVRLKLKGNGRWLFPKAWNFAGRMEELRPGARIDAVVSFEEDPYSAARGYAPWSAQVRDVRTASDAASGSVVG